MLTRLRPKLSLFKILRAFIKSNKESHSRLEKAFSGIAKQRRAIAMPYGRTAIYSILKVLAANRSGEVICPAYTCVVVPHAVVSSGLTPVFVDSEQAGFNMDLDLMEEAVGPDTLAVVVTSIFGTPVDIKKLKKFRKNHPHIFVIQDCAHSFFCDDQGTLVNQVGDAAIYGLNVSKIITTVFGGMITTDNDELATRLIKFREANISNPPKFKKWVNLIYILAVYCSFNKVVYALVNFLERNKFLERFVRYYDESIIDMPKDYLIQMTGFQAEFGISQCDDYTTIVEHRRRIADIYTRELGSLKELKLIKPILGSTYSHFAIHTELAQIIVNRCLSNGYQLGELIDYHIPSMSSYKDCKFYDNDCSRYFPGNMINLPVHSYVSEKDAFRIANLIKNIVNNSER